MNKFAFIFTLIVLLSACGFSEKSHQETLSLIPYPVSLQKQKGQFELSSKTQLVVDDNGLFASEVAEFQILMIKVLGQNLSLENGTNKLLVKISDKDLPLEGYKLEITKEQITLSAKDGAGMYYALQTLRQLLPADIESEKTHKTINLPALSIYDYPAYYWRGMNLDVSRHFFSIEYLKKHIDRLSLYKFNKLHLHLTDDQGWRIEIKKYPKLTEEGAWRIFNNQDSICMELAKTDPDYNFDEQHIITKNGQQLYGGFYSQEQIRDLVQYAQSKHIELIPEIDMPGHMMAVTNSYPHLSSTGTSGWGNLFSYPLCAGSEEVYEFLEDILSEVAELFPSKYIHIGADEVDKRFWEESPKCQAFMKKNGLKNVDELQSYFVHRIQKILASKGKETIVWDEALEGGLNPDVHVMYWRTWIAEVPEKAVKNGNRVINAQGDPLYLSRRNSMYNIYHFDVVRKTIPEELSSLMLGAHASVWAETVPSEKVADTRMFPQLIALSEAVWSPKINRDWDSFKLRLNNQLQRMTYLGVNYKYNPSSALIPIMEVDTVSKQIAITFDSEKYRPKIFYTTDGSVPTTKSNQYTGTFYVKGSNDIRAAIFVDNKMQEPVLSLAADYHKAIGKKVTYQKTWNLSYPAGDAGTLTDGYRGGTSYNDGYWQGFTSNLDVTIDMGKLTELNDFSAVFMQAAGPGVFMPDSVVVSLSDDGVQFEKAVSIKNDVPKEILEQTFKKFSGSLDKKTARYVHVVAHNPNGDFIFTDEIIIN